MTQGQAAAFELATALGAARVFDLGRALPPERPSSRATTEYQHHVVRRHGDTVRPDGCSSANDLIVTGSHVGTHIDALAHYSRDGRLFGGADAAAEQAAGFPHHDVASIEPIVGRGFLLDVAGSLGVSSLAPGYEITVADLERTAGARADALAGAEVILVRTGWAGVAADGGVPGVGADAARWLADRRPRAVGSDTSAFECLPAGVGIATALPVHPLLLVERGIHIVENVELEQLATERIFEFVIVIVALPLRGATGCPVRPLALVPPAPTT